MLYLLRYEATQLGAGQFVGFMCSRERTSMKYYYFFKKLINNS